MAMKKLFNFIKMLAFALAFVFSATARAGFTNFDALAVGSIGGSDYVALTPVATVYRYLNIASVTDGNYATLGHLSTAAQAYRGTMTGATNTAVLTCPAVANVSITAKFTIPDNYRSGGVWQIFAHYSANTTTAQWITITATVFVQPASGVTTTTGTVGTPVNPPTTTGQVPNWLTMTNGATYGRGDDVTLKLDVDAGNDPVRLEILAIRFAYRLWNGVSMLPGADLPKLSWLGAPPARVRTEDQRLALRGLIGV